MLLYSHILNKNMVARYDLVNLNIGSWVDSKTKIVKQERETKKELEAE